MSIADLVLRMIGLNCTGCNYKLTASDLQRAKEQIQMGALVCPKCQCVVKSPALNAVGFRSAGLGNGGYDKSNIVQSSLVKLEYLPNGSQSFEVPWRNSTTIFMFFFSLAWCGIVGMIAAGIAQDGGATINGVYTTDKLEVYGFLSIFVVVGLALFSVGLLGFVNKRYILVNKTYISYTDGPIWLSGVKTFRVNEIANLSIRRKHNGRINERPVYSHVVDINFKRGPKIKLCSVQNKEDAIFIEQKIEQYLNITDKPNLDEPLAS
jgi:hypothetical protein